MKKAIIIAVFFILTTVTNGFGQENKKDPKNQKDQTVQTVQTVQKTQPVKKDQKDKKDQPAKQGQKVQKAQPVKQTKKAPKAQPVKQGQKDKKIQKEKVVKAKEINLGRSYFPKNFVHNGKEYKKGLYYVLLTEKKGVPWFKVLDRKKQPLFEELAVVKPIERKQKKRRRTRLKVKKEMLKDYEYYRIKVFKPEAEIIAYFLVKVKENKSNDGKSKGKPEAETWEEKKDGK